MEVLFQKGSLSPDKFLVEVKRFAELFRDLGNPHTGEQMLRLSYIALDLISGESKLLFSGSFELGEKRGFTDEDGNFTKEALTFAKAINMREMRLPEFKDIILNWTEIQPIILQLMAERGEELSLYEPPIEVRDACIKYSCNNPGALIRLRAMADMYQWSTFQEVEEWVRYPLSEASPANAEKISQSRRS